MRQAVTARAAFDRAAIVAERRQQAHDIAREQARNGRAPDVDAPAIARGDRGPV